jgi:DNA-binding NtrC family response regulator
MKSINIALILWNTDVIELMSFVLCQRRLTSRGVEPSQGEERIQELIASCNPSVIVFDLEPPYARSAAVVQHLITRFPDRAFILTCADPVLALMSAPRLLGYPIFQKPYEPDDMVQAVASMMKRSASGRDFSKRHVSVQHTCFIA